ncbi:LysR family transcriptional regulator [Aliiglaciecola sp. SL4]|uniref:LysR family transcriptional regulator n=1 Tax=Aliiglaciecola sp. SL4 TaxID=3239806 RepID=UPI00355BF7E4
MDIGLARTFITVAQTGSFVAAANQLHVSQTTITARIKNLERQVQCTLLTRNKSGAHLSESGRRLLPYAHQLVQTWESAVRDLPVPQESTQTITIGCEQSLWNPLLSEWVGSIRQANKLVAVRVVISDYTMLNRDTKAGLIDIAIVHLPVYSNSLGIEHLVDEKLILVGTSTDANYVYVDWGDDFKRQHNLAFPELIENHTYFNYGPAALQYIIKEGGRGYFRTRVINRYLKSALLKKIDSAPEFSYPVYLIYRKPVIENIEDYINPLKELAVRTNNWF